LENSSAATFEHMRDPSEHKFQTKSFWNLGNKTDNAPQSDSRSPFFNSCSWSRGPRPGHANACLVSRAATTPGPPQAIFRPGWVTSGIGRVQQDPVGVASPSPTQATRRVLITGLGHRISAAAEGSWRNTVRIVSWLTPCSAASSRRVRLLASLRMVASCSDESFRRRDAWYDARRELPLTRRGGTTAISIGSVPGVS
jgi:hypothetical protein